MKTAKNIWSSIYSLHLFARFHLSTKYRKSCFAKYKHVIIYYYYYVFDFICKVITNPSMWPYLQPLTLSLSPVYSSRFQFTKERKLPYRISDSVSVSVFQFSSSIQLFFCHISDADLGFPVRLNLNDYPSWKYFKTMNWKISSSNVA